MIERVPLDAQSKVAEGLAGWPVRGAVLMAPIRTNQCILV
jgi:hypothetical protein